jgi:Arc/MetJ-type ribon-helix-helix transcriptional regulator
MGQITLRISDDLVERIEEVTGEETSRSEYIRESIRAQLDEERTVEERVDDLEKRVDRLESRPLYWPF